MRAHCGQRQREAVTPQLQGDSSGRPNPGRHAGFRLARPLLKGPAIPNREATMRTTTRATGHQIPCASVPASAAAAITFILFSLGLLGACGPAGGVMDADAGAVVVPDSSVAKPDAGRAADA